MMDDHEQAKLQRLRGQMDEMESLIALEKERATLSIEILESLLLRIADLERRVFALEGA